MEARRSADSAANRLNLLQEKVSQSDQRVQSEIRRRCAPLMIFPYDASFHCLFESVTTSLSFTQHSGPFQCALCSQTSPHGPDIILKIRHMASTAPVSLLLKRFHLFQILTLSANRNLVVEAGIHVKSE